MSNPFIQIGIVTGFEITNNREGEQKVVMLQVAVGEDYDVQSVQLFCQAGMTYIPPIDSAVMVFTVAEGFKIAVASDDGLNPIDTGPLEEGERLQYSQDYDGVHRTEILQKAGGDLELRSIDGDELACATQTMQNTGAVSIQNENGSINMAADGVVSAGNGDDYVALAQKILDELSAISEALNTHVHMGNMGSPTGTPIQAELPNDPITYTPSEVASTNLKAE